LKLVKKHDTDLTAQVERLQREVDSLRAAFSIFEGLATPRMARLYQQMVGGLAAAASNADWRMHGFYPLEEDVAWTQFDRDVAIYMLLLKGESYSCALRLVRTPHIELPDSIVVKVNGEEMQPIYDEDEQAYTFEFHAQRTGWHAFSFNSRECLQPSLRDSQDTRRLGVLFRSLSIIPIIP
jgi:hypothetical protein